MEFEEIGCSIVIIAILLLLVLAAVLSIYDDFWGDSQDPVCYHRATQLASNPDVRKMMSDQKLSPQECQRITDIIEQQNDDKNRQNTLTLERREIEEFQKRANSNSD